MPVPMGTAAALSWTVSAPDAFRIYNFLTRPQGGTAWTAAGSVTGTAFLLDASLLTGTQEVRMESGGGLRRRQQPVTSAHSLLEKGVNCGRCKSRSRTAALRGGYRPRSIERAAAGSRALWMRRKMTTVAASTLKYMR